MKINKKLHSVALASIIMILFLILVSSMASAQTEPDHHNITPPEITSGTGNTSDDQVLSEGVSAEGNATESIQAATPNIPKTRITTHETASNPDIYGDKIVWQDNRNGNWDIYIFDLSAKTEIHTTNITDQINPAIYGNLVVWEDERNGGHDIYVEDVSAKTQTRISKSGEAHNPAIYDTRIVWQDERNGISNIYMYNLSAKKETQITTSGTAYKPDIYGNIVVWEDERDGNNDIFIYDISTQKETQISTSGKADDPRIYGNRIVWDTIYDYPSAIYAYDLSTHKETRISDGISYKPDIYDNKIVYEDNRNDASGNTDIYMYDLSTNKETMITFEDLEDPENNPYQVDPAIYGNRIVYTKRYPQGDIYMATLGSNLPVAAFSASPTSGNLPLKVQFSDKSTGSPTSWKWNFGDGKTSISKNPAYTYAKAGKYTVSLTVKNAAGTNTKTIKNYITVKTTPVKPVAAFYASPTSGNAPLKVTFTDKSTGSPTSWKWSFGDGKTSTSKSPTYTYSKAGKYTVSLTVKNAAGSSSKTIKNYIVVNTLKAPVAAFYASPRSGKAPLKVQFTDKSANSPTSWKWNFGDKTYSTAKNPVHKYSKAGKYTVSLTVKNAKGSNTKTISGYIVVSK